MTSSNDASKPLFTRKLLRPLIKASATLLASTHLVLCRGPRPMPPEDARGVDDAAADVRATSDGAPTEDRVEPQDAPSSDSERSDSESADGPSEDGSGSDGR